VSSTSTVLSRWRCGGAAAGETAKRRNDETTAEARVLDVRRGIQEDCRLDDGIGLQLLYVNAGPVAVL
jgi:hypothetical protein